MPCLRLPCLRVLPFAWTLIACQPRAGAHDSAAASVSPAPVALRLDRSEYRAGGQVGMAIVNGTDDTFVFNPCVRVVERQTGTGWTPIEEPDRVCTMEGWLLGPRETQNASTELPATLAPGRYRLGIPMSRDVGAPTDEKVVATSEPFAVVR